MGVVGCTQPSTSKALKDRDLTDLSAGWFVAPNAHLDATKAYRIGCGCLLLCRLVNKEVYIIVQAVGTLVNHGIVVVIDTIDFVVIGPSVVRGIKAKRGG